MWRGRKLIFLSVVGGLSYTDHRMYFFLIRIISQFRIYFHKKL